LERKSDNWPKFVRIILAPTRAVFDSKLLKSWQWLTIKGWSRFFLFANLTLLFFLPPFWRTDGILSRLGVGVLIYLIPVSRVAEIFYAFYYDALEKLNEFAKHRSTLSKADRVKLAAQSYAEVSVCFAIFFRAMPQSWFSNPPSGPYRFWETQPFDWLYFSWVTITTTGYGDITPKAAIARAVSMIEIAFGLMLIVFAVGTYLSSKSDQG
jgi:Ion channel